jgi:lipoprotein-releasing system ATP-binding protein
MDKAPPILEARGLTKTYGQGKAAVHVLRGLDIEIAAGEFIVLLGPSGCGKSSLLNILGLMDSPNSGEIRFSGRAAERLSEKERSYLRNERLGFVFQFDSLLPEFTILENVAMPSRIAMAQGRGPALPEEAEHLALDLLSNLGLKALRERFPSQISGGERQRVALCRALVNSPQLLLADEPTGNLDKRSGELVFKDLKTLAESHRTAVLMATHNESAREHASRVLRMLDGALLGQGRV